MRHLALLSMILGTWACGGGDPAPLDAGALENSGFAVPTITTTANTKNGEAWDELGPANWDCLDTASSDEPSTVEIVVSGNVIGRNTDDEVVPGAEISVFAGTDLGGEPVVTTTADENGAYSLALPIGSERVALKTSADEFIDTYLLNQIYPPDLAAQEELLEPVGDEIAESLLALVNLSSTPGTGVLAGAIRDCDGHEVGGAIATVSTSPGAASHADGAETYYFTAGPVHSLPVVRSQLGYTNRDGLFMVVELPVADISYFQVWGFLPAQDPASDELSLIAELPAPVLPDSIVTASLEALRTE